VEFSNDTGALVGSRFACGLFKFIFGYIIGVISEHERSVRVDNFTH